MNPQPKICRADPPKNIISPDSAIGHMKDFLRTAKKPIIAIVGPTASGKTNFSIRLAKEIDGEVINADSRQFYKGMDIGTAKITLQEMCGVPHHLLSFLSPDEECPAGVFKPLAEKKAEEISSRGKVPLLVGGSGLFVDVLRKNYSVPRVPPQKEFRAELEAVSSEELHKRLESYDPEAAQKMSPQNKTVSSVLWRLSMSPEKRSLICKKPMLHYSIFCFWEYGWIQSFWKSGFIFVRKNCGMPDF
jgi:hypothetical protein